MGHRVEEQDEGKIDQPLVCQRWEGRAITTWLRLDFCHPTNVGLVDACNAYLLEELHQRENPVTVLLSRVVKVPLQWNIALQLSPRGGLPTGQSQVKIRQVKILPLILLGKDAQVEKLRLRESGRRLQSTCGEYCRGRPQAFVIPRLKPSLPGVR